MSPAPETSTRVCPACGAPSVPAFVRHIEPYACGSRVHLPVNGVPQTAMLTQSVACCRAQMDAIRALVMKSCCGG